MDEKIYIVTSGCYSDYNIEAVFKNKEKAEAYCQCHRDCEIEEYNFSDDRVFTTYNKITIRCNTNDVDKMNINFEKLSNEDDKFYAKNYCSVYVYNFSDLYASITLNRVLPDDYDKDKISDKYKKVMMDIISEVKYMIAESGIIEGSGYKAAKELGSMIQEAIEAKYSE